MITFPDFPVSIGHARPDAGRTPALPRIVAALVLALLLGGCAAGPGNAVIEQLDERTGITVTRLERPIGLVARAARGANLDPFAQLAPFETNRMGRRELYLWIAVPDERGGAEPPILFVGADTPAMTPLGRDAATLPPGGIPYPAPAPWSKTGLFAIDAATLRKLADAGSIEVSVRYADQRVMRFSGTPQPADLLQQFLRSVGL